MRSCGATTGLPAPRVRWPASSTTAAAPAADGDGALTPSEERGAAAGCSREETAMRIPAPAAGTLELRIADLLERDRFGERWHYWPMTERDDGFWELDVESLGLADGD